MRYQKLLLSQGGGFKGITKVHQIMPGLSLPCTEHFSMESATCDFVPTFYPRRNLFINRR